jgi:purine-binding chemotaxis protein CheW
MADQKPFDPLDMKGKYLTFNLREEFYGVNVNWILQIIAVPDITEIPKTPDFVKGVINLRGKIIPVIDLRLRFRLPPKDYDERTSIVVIKTTRPDRGEIYTGLIIDKVLEVLDIHQDEIEPPPAFGVDAFAQFIAGMAKVRNRVVSLLNIDDILMEIDLQNIHNSKE